MKLLQTITRGCSKNSVDTEHILSQITEKYKILSFDGDPDEDVKDLDYVDCVLINTCGFIGDAKEESIQVILNVVERKKQNKVGKIIVFGCLSQRYASELPELIPEVDLWLGARDNNAVVKALGCETKDENKRYLSKNLPYAYLKISEGCDRRCSYCAIPFIRGAHHSVPMDELVAEAKFLASTGVKELILIAQDTTYYGLDIYKRRALGELLQRLSEIDGIKWIRIHYSYPADFPEDVLEQMANNPKVCRYMDIPLQHISDKILSNMHRGVSGAWTRELISKMRKKVPGLALRTTMIVGHPGETREEFKELMSFVEEAKFERLGAFTYSEEEGTYGALHFKDSVSKITKKNRLDKLMQLQSKISYNYNLSRVGSEIEVLVDSYNDDILVCRSEFESPDVDGEILVRYPYGNIVEMLGTFIKVRITNADEYDLIAEML